MEFLFNLLIYFCVSFLVLFVMLFIGILAGNVYHHLLVRKGKHRDIHKERD